MSGHSKWKNNLGRKTSQDAKKAANFGKLSKSITVAVLEGGSGDPNFNPRLRVAIDTARSESMPKDNIERAIAKGIGPDKQMLVSTLYEIFGPHGSMLLATATTDNTNRTTSEIRTLVDRNGGKLGNSGSVGHQFTHCGMCEVGHADRAISDDNILSLVDKIQVSDYKAIDGGHLIIFFPFENIGKVKQVSETTGLTLFDGPHAIFLSSLDISLSDEAMVECDKLIKALEAHDDVQEVFTNIA